VEVRLETEKAYIPRHLKPPSPSVTKMSNVIRWFVSIQDGTESGNLVDVGWKSLIEWKAWKGAGVLAVPR
jgi:hypothetical protein